MLEFIVGTMIFVIIVTVCLGVFSRKIAAKSKGGQYLRRALRGNMALMASLVQEQQKTSPPVKVPTS